jgi:hypothetical protein
MEGTGLVVDLLGALLLDLDDILVDGPVVQKRGLQLHHMGRALLAGCPRGMWGRELGGGEEELPETVLFAPHVELLGDLPGLIGSPALRPYDYI